jgi:glycosyltransferase involved in cell wall biosynthesis
MTMNEIKEIMPHPLRIMHLISSIGRLSGGLGATALSLAREHSLMGHQAQIWCHDSLSDARDALKEGTLGEEQVATFPVRGPWSIGYSPTMEREALSASGQSYMVLHQHGIWMANSRVTNLWRTVAARPTVVAPQGTLEAWALKRSAWKKRLATFAYEGQNLRSASCLQATSMDEATSFRNYGLINPIAILPNGIADDWLGANADPERFFKRFSVPSDRRLLLFLSRIHPKKGLPLLFRAMAQIKQSLQDWLLVVAGPDERGHLADIQSLVQKLGIENRVRFLGPLFGSDKRDAYAASDLFVLPTHSENFGIVVAEALGAGVPVLTTRGTPWRELEIRNCGWWVDVGVAAIRDALSEAIHLAKDELRARGQRGRILAAEKYTWSSIGKQSVQLYYWLLGRSDKPEFVILD